MAVYILMNIALLLVCASAVTGGAANFNIEPATRRTDPANEVVVNSAVSQLNLDCSLECYVRSWCRAATVDAVTPKCDLYVLQTYVGAGNIASDNESFAYVEMQLNTAPLPYIKATPGGFPDGSRFSVKFRPAWTPMLIYVTFYASSQTYFMLVIDEQAGTLTRQIDEQVENSGGFPFDSSADLCELEVVRVQPKMFNIHINGSLFTTVSTPLDLAVATIQMYGNLRRWPLEFSLEEADGMNV